MEGFCSISGEAFLRTFVIGLLCVGEGWCVWQRATGPPWLSARVTSPNGSPEQPGSHQGSAMLRPSPECSTCTDFSSGLGGEQL